jgi:hypothetical protein
MFALIFHAYTCTCIFHNLTSLDTFKIHLKTINNNIDNEHYTVCIDETNSSISIIDTLIFTVLIQEYKCSTCKFVLIIQAKTVCLKTQHTTTAVSLLPIFVTQYSNIIYHDV